MLLSIAILLALSFAVIAAAPPPLERNLATTNAAAAFNALWAAKLATNGNAIGLTNMPASGVEGLPFVSVSPKGIALGTSSRINDGADFGPDTAGTTTVGIQEAIDALNTSDGITNCAGGGTMVLAPGTYHCTSPLLLPVATNRFNVWSIKGQGGDGQLNTVVNYRGSTRTNFVTTKGPVGSAQGGLYSFTSEGVAWTYEPQYTNHIFWLMQPWFVHFKNCNFSSMPE